MQFEIDHEAYLVRMQYSWDCHVYLQALRQWDGRPGKAILAEAGQDPVRRWSVTRRCQRILLAERVS